MKAAITAVRRKPEVEGWGATKGYYVVDYQLIGIDKLKTKSFHSKGVNATDELDAYRHVADLLRSRGYEL